jgi:RNA polymerase sigma factor for flagellar operon FliA
MTTAEGLWQRYRKQGDATAREALVEQHLGLVRHAARELLNRVGDSVSFDDMVGAGSLGLLQAVDGFDPSRGFAFTTYALQRIRGAMLDELRAADWRPRSVRVRGRQLQHAQRTIEAKTGRAAKPQEIADSVGVDLETYWQWRSDMDGGTVVAFERAPQGGDNHAPALADVLADPAGQAPMEQFEQQDRLSLVKSLIAELPERIRLVLSLSYFEGLSNRQIAQTLHVTESRVSQMRTAGLTKLKLSMASMGAL